MRDGLMLQRVAGESGGEGKCVSGLGARQRMQLVEAAECGRGKGKKREKKTNNHRETRKRAEVGLERDGLLQRPPSAEMQTWWC